MKLLLDTHVLLWWQDDSQRLSRRAKALLRDSDNEIHWSTASTWELAIKLAVGKIKLHGPLRPLLSEALREQGISVLPIENTHALHVADLPLHHHDPFDRMLVAQAQLGRMALLSSDKELSKYEVERVW